MRQRLTTLLFSLLVSACTSLPSQQTSPPAAAPRQGESQGEGADLDALIRRVDAALGNDGQLL